MAQFVQVREPRPGYIYIIAEKTSTGRTGYYKVGKTQNLDERIAELQTGNPHELVYEEKIPVVDMDAAEQSAHDAVRRDHRTHENGGKEWYSALSLFDFSFKIKLRVMRFIRT
jgi:hypothetical protein